MEGEENRGKDWKSERRVGGWEDVERYGMVRVNEGERRLRQSERR